MKRAILILLLLSSVAVGQTTTTYKGLTVYSADPTGSAGLQYQNNFKMLADRSPTANQTATTDPTVTDDVDEGYYVGSLWLNTSAPSVWYCYDNTDGAAGWVDISAAGGAASISDTAYGADWDGVTTYAPSKNVLYDYLNSLSGVYASVGGAYHDGFSDFVANEHIDWTADQGDTNLHANNIPDLSGTYQPLDDDLTTIAALNKTDSNFIVGNGTTWVLEDAETARTSLGVGTIATQAANLVNIDGGAIDGTTIGVSSRSTGEFSSGSFGRAKISGYPLVMQQSADSQGILIYESGGVASFGIYLNANDHGALTASEDVYFLADNVRFTTRAYGNVDFCYGGLVRGYDFDAENALRWSIDSSDGAASFGSLALTTKLADSYISSAATWNAKLSAETDPIVGAIDGIIEADGEGNISAATINAGTDLSADLEEESHSAEHAVSAADSVFPADPDADRVLIWDDDPGELTWIDHTIGSAVQAWDADLDTMAAAGIGIADDDMLQVDADDVADDEYARFTANGLESRSVSEMKADLWLVPTTTTATDDNAAETWDWSVSNRHQITLDNTQTPCVLTFSNEPNESEGFTLILIQDATGGTEITWPATIYWSGGTEPTVAQGASERTVCTFRRINSVTYGAGFEYAQAP